jgi:antagonist of KipI
MSIVVMRPGLLTTIQDRGRRGNCHLGIRPCGVMDPVAARVANLLAGNSEDEAVLELTLLGPTLRFEQATWIGLAGADFQATLEGRLLLNNARHWIDAGGTLELKQAIRGCRAYLAIAGGFVLPSILGSCSTDLRSNWGGVLGRALQAGDVLPSSPTNSTGNSLLQLPTASPSATSWSVELPGISAEREHRIPILAGSEQSWFTRASWENLLATPYTITPASDRMGYRLQGEALALEQPRELLSTASLRGNLQVPASGQPILLLADHPTTGGYPVIATAATAAWPILAQAKPGDQLRFVETTRAGARQMLVEQELELKKISRAIELRLRC